MNLTLRQAAVELGILTEERFDKLVRPDKMTSPNWEDVNGQ